MLEKPIPTGNTIADWDGWWIEIRCMCRSLFHPCHLAAKEGSGAIPVARYVSRLRCRRCGQRPRDAVMVSFPAGPPHYDQQRVAVPDADVSG